MNDAHGHAAGDALLRAVAATLAAGTRNYDVVARLGGDEFGILLAETDAADAKCVVKRIHACLHDVMRQNGWPVTFSIGLATGRGEQLSAAVLIQSADALMYQAKRQGPGGVAANLLPE
jgi:diguanylate cyclase (GGDEF)-like protein